MTEEIPAAHSWRPRRFMVIVGHPDDADFGPAGAAAAWIAGGAEGWLVCCTSGDAGGEDPDLDPLELARAREEEQRRAAAVVGYAGVTFLHQPDGGLLNDLPLREMLVREIRSFKPDAVFCWRSRGGHPRRRRRQPHRSPSRRDGGRRRGLPRGAKPDGLSVAGEEWPRPTGSGGCT